MHCHQCDCTTLAPSTNQVPILTVPYKYSTNTIHHTNTIQYKYSICIIFIPTSIPSLDQSSTNFDFTIQILYKYHTNKYHTIVHTYTIQILFVSSDTKRGVKSLPFKTVSSRQSVQQVLQVLWYIFIELQGI